MFTDNLLDNPTQVEGYRALLGLHEHRPFECVGEQAESLLSFTWIAHQSDWSKSAVVTALTQEMPELLHPTPSSRTGYWASDTADSTSPHPLKHWEAFLPKAPLTLPDLAGQSVLIVGVGREGQAVASRLVGLDPAPTCSPSTGEKARQHKTFGRLFRISRSL